MANKQFNTRISLKYDTLEQWNKSTFILLKGEIACVEVPAQTDVKGGSITAPQLLFKVGDGVKPFSQLPWASGLAADVYAWAKKASLDWKDLNDTFKGELAEFIEGKMGEYGITDVKEGTGVVVSRGEGVLSSEVTVAVDETWMGTLSANAVKESKDYTDALSTAVDGKLALKADKTELEAEETRATTAETAISNALTAEVKRAGDAEDALEKAYKAADAQVLSDAKAYTDQEVGKIDVAYKAADQALSTALTGFVDTKIKALDYTDAATDGQFVTKVTETDGVISVSRSAITLSDVTDLTANLNGLSTAVNGLDGRLDTVEGTVGTLTADVGALKTDVGTLKTDMSQAKTDIADLKTDTAALTTRMTTAEGDIDALEGRMTQAETDIDALEAKDTALSNALTAETQRATAAEEALDTRLTTAESDIDALETEVEKKAYISALTAETARAEGVEEFLSGAISALSGQVVEGVVSNVTGEKAIVVTTPDGAGTVRNVALKTADSDSVTLTQDANGLKAEVKDTYVNGLIDTKIGELAVTDTAEEHKFVTAVSETAGKITVTRETLSTDDVQGLETFVNEKATALDSAVSAATLSAAKKYTDDEISGITGTFTGATSKTVTAMTQTDGKVTLTATDIEIAHTQVTDAGTAITYNVNSTDKTLATSADALPTNSMVSAFVADQIKDLEGALHFRGVVTRQGTETDLEAITRAITNPKSGDVVVMGDNSKEYIYTGEAWREVGDEGMYVKKSQTIAGIDLQGNITADELNEALSTIHKIKVDDFDAEIVDGTLGLNAGDGIQIQPSAESYTSDNIKIAVDLFENGGIAVENHQLKVDTSAIGLDALETKVDKHIGDASHLSAGERDAWNAKAEVSAVNNAISAAVGTLDGSATIATVSNDIVTLKAGITETDGVVSNSTESDITLAKVAKTGMMDDLSQISTIYFNCGDATTVF